MLTVEEKSLRLLLKIWTFVFAIAGLTFVIVPQKILEVLNLVSLRIAPTLPPLPIPEDRFWLVLTFSLMTTITALSYSAMQDLRRRRDLVVFLLISKATSSITFTLFFLLHQHSLGYLLGTLTDGSIFLITLVFYRRALRSSQLIL